MSDTIIIKLGGSVISTEDKLFNFEYLKKLRIILEKRIEQGDKFCLVLGGGYTMRMYRDLAKEEGGIDEDKQLHWIGTTVNVLHAEITRAFFSDIAEERPVMFEDYYSDKKLKMDKPLVIGGGGRAGHSGDVDAILLANKTGAKTIVTFKNIDHLYSADPNKVEGAHIVKEASWDEYFEIIDGKSKHEPGGNYVVDPVASQMAKESGIKFKVVNGQNLDNIEKLLNGEEFIGSVVG